MPLTSALGNRRDAVIEMMRRELYVPVIHIDTNLINSRGKVEAMNRLERLAEDGLIAMNISDTGLSEALAGNDAQRTRKALAQIYTINNTTPDTSRFTRRLKAHCSRAEQRHRTKGMMSQSSARQQSGTRSLLQAMVARSLSQEVSWAIEKRLGTMCGS